MYLSAWLWFWNIGILALSICVLAGCRSKLESNYSLINWPRSTLTLIWGDECARATADVIPDVYKLGASGTCRVFDGNTLCSSSFPPSINLASAVLEDLPASLEKCRELIDKPIDHSKAATLGKVLAAFLITSIVLTVASSIVSPFDGGVGPIVTGILAVDALLIFASLILVIAMVNFEGGGYLTNVYGGDFSDREMIGVAMWMLAAMLIARVVSNPWLTMAAIVILLPIVLVFLLFLVRTRGFFSVVRAVEES
ncbi:hypothetical protein F5X68DRAFT_63996 [Plectosphaerella plurivora]|uniref:Uncharacterized protein n=1 Tax=Plectosphaerella plurivora TaxID=936078 RepID=A0A9P9A5S5_9PEZI|nr:hypothetical protein F5X68DRAFT_63996 [Plectosphaerella plurivora]